MQEFLIPTCYFPSTVLFLDDGHDFLLNFVLHLDEGLAYRVFDIPENALAYIHKKRCELALISSDGWSGYTTPKYCPLTHQSMSLPLAAVHAEIYNRYRFSEISVLVVDNAMPLMDGITFCAQIDNDNIKKILLIDSADEPRAIAALRHGVIDKYIKKNDANAAYMIRKGIHDLQWQYFNMMSVLIFRLLSLKPPPCLYDKAFLEFFHQFREENDIIEFYLVDTSGSFLLMDEDANLSFLIMKNAQDIQLYADLAQKMGVNHAVVGELLKGDKIPGVWQSEVLIKPLKALSQSLVPAKRLVADTTYYYAHLKGNALFDVRQQNILSYHRYLEELDAEMFLLG